MVTVKLGSKGDSVKQLQRALGLTDDGIFGKNTEQAVKNFQKEHGLTADGIVGTKTWIALGINDDVSIIFKPLSKHITKAPGRAITYLVIHFTAGSKSVAGTASKGVYNTFMNRSASADFAVDDQDIVQFNPDLGNYYCWAVGDKKNTYSSGGSLYGKATNRNCINIEICSTCTPNTGTAVSVANHKGWSFTDAALNNAVKLTKLLMKRYNIPINNVIRHYDVSGKLCPGIMGWNNETIYDVTTGKATKEKSDSSAWLKFKDKIK